MSVSSGANSRIFALDGLRGVFALAVVAYHYTSWMQLNVPNGVKDALAQGAIYAVCGFFVISGASMAIAYHKRPPIEFQSAAAFYTRRFFRIAPLYYLALLVFSAGRAAQCVLGDTCTLDAGLLLANITFVFGFGKAALQSEVVAGWSIGIEWVFYFLFPLLLPLATRSLRSLVALAAIGALTLIAWDLWYLETQELYWPNYAQFPAYLWYFVTGLAIGVIVTRTSDKGRSKRSILLFAGALCCYLAYASLTSGGYDNGVDVAGPTAWIAALLTVFLVGTASLTPTPGAVGKRIFETAGDLSYSVYLMHFPVSLGVQKVGLTGFVGAGVALVSTLVLSVFIFNFVEKPLVSFGRRWSGRKTGRQNAPSPKPQVP